MRCALYHRVSTRDQNATNARDALLKAATARGLEVVWNEEETGSGARNDRPKLQELLQLARENKFEYVLVWKLDRFGRSSLDLQSNIKALNQAGVTFVATSQGLESGPVGSAMSSLMFTMMAAFAEFELELNLERTLQGMERARKKGTKSGKSIGGQYRHLKTGVLEQSKITKLRASGYSYKKIAREVGCSVFEVRKVINGRTNERP